MVQRLHCLAWCVVLAACATLPNRAPAMPPAVLAAPPATATTTAPDRQLEREEPPIVADRPVASVPPAAVIAVDEPDPARNVFFAPGTTAFAAESRETLGETAQKLKADPRLTVLLVGHADDSGSNEYCVAVAATRTNAVREELQKLGVPARQIRRRSLGCEPLVPGACATDACVRARRRVELQFLEPDKPRVLRRSRKP